MMVKDAIEAGDAVGLRRLVFESPGLADELIVWGKGEEIRTHPLHYVSDVFFTGTLSGGVAVQLVDVLISAGADVNFAAGNGETALIGAASLGAEEVGLRLIAAGARVDALGGFQETALHWAAFMALDGLVAELVRVGVDLELKDGRYFSTPLGWAVHAESQAPAEVRAKFDGVIAALKG